MIAQAQTLYQVFSRFRWRHRYGSHNHRLLSRQLIRHHRRNKHSWWRTKVKLNWHFAARSPLLTQGNRGWRTERVSVGSPFHTSWRKSIDCSNICSKALAFALNFSWLSGEYSRYLSTAELKKSCMTFRWVKCSSTESCLTSENGMSQTALIKCSRWHCNA